MRPVLALVVAFVPWLPSCASSNAPAAASTARDPDATCAPQPPDPTRFPLDPVALRSGVEVAGSDERVERSGLYTYAFASAENQVAFRADPAAIEVQLGGACARMGPLSGQGNVTLHTLHDGKLYLFASKNCRTAFAKDPASYLETADPAPSPDVATPEARRRGAELLDKALTWIGGARTVDAVRTLVETRARDEKAGDRTYRVTNELQLDLEHGWARETECWDDGCFGNVIGSQGAFSTGKQWRELVPDQRAAFERQAHRGVLATLRRRHAPDAIVHEVRPGVVGIWSDGAETRLVIEDGGAITALEHAGRAPNLTRAVVSVALGDWRPCGPIRMPHRRAISTGDGARRTTSEVVLDSIVVDGPLDPSTFQY